MAVKGTVGLKQRLFMGCTVMLSGLWGGVLMASELEQKGAIVVPIDVEVPEASFTSSVKEKNKLILKDFENIAPSPIYGADYIRVSNVTPIPIYDRPLSQANIDWWLEDEQSEFMEYGMTFKFEWKPELIDKIASDYKFYKNNIVGYIDIINNNQVYERISLDENSFSPRYVDADIVFPLPIKLLDKFYVIPYIYINSTYVNPDSYKQSLYKRTRIQKEHAEAFRKSMLNKFIQPKFEVKRYENPFRVPSEKQDDKQ